MFKFKLVYGYALCRDDREIVGEHVIEAKSMRSAMHKADKIMGLLGDRSAPSNSTERCLASMQRWESAGRSLYAMKFSLHWANFTARLYAPNRAALAPYRVRKGSAHMARRRSRQRG